MVSRRNFFTISMIMLVLLLMLQAPEVLKEQMNDYDSNAYAAQADTKWNRASVQAVSKRQGKEAGRYVVLIGASGEAAQQAETHQEGAALVSVVEQWCLYSKRYLECYPRLSAYTFRPSQRPEAVLVEAAALEPEKDTQRLEDLNRQGVDLVFCGLPDLAQLEKNGRLRRLLGIRAVAAKKVQAKGIRLFDGLLLGGEKIYCLSETTEPYRQDMELTMTWCQTAPGTKTYMAGMLDDTVKNEDLPALIWRSSTGSAEVFVINGTYMEDYCGIGFLEGIFYEMQDYALYPVINAQNLSILSCPVPGNANEKTMLRLYSRTLDAVYRDLVWPGISLTAERSGKRPTCMLAPQLDPADGTKTDAASLVYAMKLLREEKGEAGISGDSEDLGGQEKEFLERELTDYSFLSFYQGDRSDQETKRILSEQGFGDVRTVLVDRKEGPFVGYFNEDITKQMILNKADKHTFLDDLRMNSVQTALGYSSIALDLSRIVYPQSEEDVWEKVYDRFSGNAQTYWKGYEAFDATTLAQSDRRIRRFLAICHTQERIADTITLSVENLEEEAFFMLRLHGETVERIQGAECKAIQEGAYLIRVLEEQVRITLKDASDKRYYY